MLSSRQNLSAFFIVCVLKTVMTNPCFFWSGAQYFDKYCFKMVQNYVNWLSAQAKCGEDFGRLVNPTTHEKRSFLTDMVAFSPVGADWWIGSVYEGRSAADTATSWNDVRDCLSITGTRNNVNLPFFQNVSCGLNQSFICEKYVGNPCDHINTGGVYFYAHCYTFSTTPVYWDGNSDPCRAGDLAELAWSDIYSFFKQYLIQIVEIEITTPLEEWVFPEAQGIHFDGVSGVSFYVLTYGEARVLLDIDQSSGSTGAQESNEEAYTESHPWPVTSAVDITVTPKRRIFSVKKYKNGVIDCRSGAMASGQDQHCVQNISISWSAQQGQPIVLRGGSTVPTYLVHVNIDFPFDRIAIYTANDSGIWLFPKFPSDVHVFLAANDTDNNGVFRWIRSKSNVSRSDWLPYPATADDDDRVHLTWLAGRKQHKTIGLRAVNGSITSAWPLCYQYALEFLYYIVIPHGMSDINNGTELVVSTAEEGMVYLYLVHHKLGTIQNWATYERSAHFENILNAKLTPTYRDNTSISEGYAAYLATTHNVTVVLYLRSTGGASSTLIYPSNYYKQSYFILTYWIPGLVNLITVTARYGNTEVTIKMPETFVLANSYHFGFPLESQRFITTCLGASETIQLEAPQDMSGVYVYASKSIAVFAGTRGIAGSYSNTLDMVLPVEVSSSRHVIQGSMPPLLSTDLSSLIAKLSQNSTSFLSGPVLVSPASTTLQSGGNGGGLFTTQSSTTTTSEYQTTSTSANLVLMKVLALYNATQIKITSQDVRLSPQVTMNQGEVLDIPLLTNTLYVMESDQRKPFQAIKVVLGLSGACVTQILPNRTQSDRYDFEVQQDEQIVRVVTSSNTSNLKDFNCDSVTDNGLTYFRCSKLYSTGNYHLRFGNTTGILEVYTQGSDAEFCHQMGVLQSPPLTLPRFDPTAYSRQYQPDAPINTACLITTTTTQEATTTTSEVTETVPKSETTTHGATTRSQAATTTSQEDTITSQAATTTSQEDTITSQAATTTSQEDTITSQAATTTSQADTTTSQADTTTSQAVTTTSHADTTTSQAATTTSQAATTTSQAATTTSQAATTTSQAATTTSQAATTTSQAATTTSQAATTTSQAATTTSQAATTTSQAATTTSQAATTTSQAATTTSQADTTTSQAATTTSQAATTTSQAATTTSQAATTTSQAATTTSQAATTTSQEDTTISHGAILTTKGANSTTQGETSSTQGATSNTHEPISATHEATSTTPEATTTPQATTLTSSTVSRVITSSFPTTSNYTEKYVIPNMTTLRNLKMGAAICPCICFKMSNNTDLPGDLILFGSPLRRHLGTKNGKMSAFSRRELSSHWDGRTSSQVIGLSGVAILICWSIFLFSLDILKVCGYVAVTKAQHNNHHNM